MNKYKRLTNKDWKENYDLFEDVDCDTCTEDCGECERSFNALVRLAELEDKIENGTLVEFPCKRIGELDVIRNGINIRLGVTEKDIEIITTALREYAKNHPNPKCHAYEANDIAKIIENQSNR